MHRLRRLPRRISRTDGGASAVEFALVVIPLLMIVFGIIVFGLILFTFISAQHTAREAARAAAVGDFATCADLTQFVDDRLGVTPDTLTMAPDVAGAPKPGDRITITITFPTETGANGALEGIVGVIPGGSMVIPDALTVTADSRIEVVGSATTCS